MMKKGVGAALILTAALMSLSCTSMATAILRNSDPHVWDEALPPEDSVWVLFTCIGDTSVKGRIVSGAPDGITAYNGVEVDWKWNGNFGGTWVRLPPGPASFVGNFSAQWGNTPGGGSIIYHFRGAEFSFDFTETGNPHELAGKFYQLILLREEDGWRMRIYLMDIEEQLSKKAKVQVGYRALEPYKIATIPFSNIAEEEKR
ncbi:MAG: hypothetical protein LBL43_03265 [Treponema sp.]|nr:hypothetical protein [Treponema sp.]